MANERIEFGSVLDRRGSEKKLWLIIIPIVLGVVGLAAYGLSQVSKTSALERDLGLSRKQTAEMEKTIAERDKLIAQARADEGVLRSAGEAAALFVAVDRAAVESGLVIALPNERAAKVLLYGLQPPPEGQEYVIAARGRDGAPKLVGRVLPSDRGTAFVMAKDLPEGTNAIQLMLAPAGQENLDAATPRIAARFPADENERGILQQPPVQARTGRRAASR